MDKKKKIIIISVVAAALAICIAAAVVLIVLGRGEHQHKFGEWTVDCEVSCTLSGREKRTCEKCDAIEYREIYRLGHNFGTDNICTRCRMEIQPTEGLGYRETDEGLYVFCNLAEGDKIEVPLYHDGKKVVGVSEDGFWTKPIKKIFLPDGLTVIGDRAFNSCDALAEVYMPVTLTKIGDMAFTACLELTSIEIGPSVQTIGNSAFYHCEKLASIKLPDSVTSIGVLAFSGCTSMSEATLGKGITVLSDSVFYDCLALTNVTLNGEVTEMQKFAFRNTAIVELHLGTSFKTMGEGAIENCEKLRNIYFGGTRAEWKAVKKAFGWYTTSTGDFLVRCSDGALTRVDTEVDLK